MRDITITQGKSFGSWWVTKCWIDEMISFLAEHGGFMKMTTTQSSLDVANKQTTSKEVSRQGSRYSSGSDDFSMPNVTQSQPDRAPFPSAPGPKSHDMDMNNASHDDSGIGIRTPEEDFPMDKFDFPQGAEHELLGPTEYHRNEGSI